jgi:ribosome-binding factor A
MLAGLEAAKGRIRRALAERVSMKYVPELTFELDASVDEGERIDRALRAEAKAERKLARRREAAGAVEAHEGHEGEVAS